MVKGCKQTVRGGGGTFFLGGASKQNGLFSEEVPYKIASIPSMFRIGPDAEMDQASLVEDSL